MDFSLVINKSIQWLVKLNRRKVKLNVYILIVMADWLIVLYADLFTV